jgi:predicted SprT family Zn-dependent metalloprotease
MTRKALSVFRHYRGQTLESMCESLECPLPRYLPEEVRQVAVLVNPRLRRSLGRFRASPLVGLAWIELHPRVHRDARLERDTLLHEAAHAWVYLSGIRERDSHGHSWRSLARQLGARPQPLVERDDVSFEIVPQERPRKPVAYCPTCAVHIYRKKALARGRVWRHMCRTVLEEVN